MPGGGTPGFGSGGVTNAYPGRGYPEYGTSDGADRNPDEFVGGARGPAALPSRTTVPNGPTPATYPWGSTERAEGVISYHRGAFVEDAGAPRLGFDFTFAHGTVPWSRPTYSNRHGYDQFHAPTQQPSWSANAVPQVDSPSSTVPISNKHIGSFTVRRPFGDNSSGTEFETGSLADYVDGIPSGLNQSGRRRMAQSKTHNPTLVNSSVYATAGSYGQTTAQLPTQPSNLPVSSPYGSY
jgi:hypothetical protein